VKDTDENLLLVTTALTDLGAAWGPDDSSWKPIPTDSAWLRRQSVFCLTSNHGAIDIFREVKGLEGLYAVCRARADLRHTLSKIPYLSLSDQDMLTCQMSLPEASRRLDRVAFLTKLLKS
jgi:hypothetical protein